MALVSRHLGAARLPPGGRAGRISSEMARVLAWLGTSVQRAGAHRGALAGTVASGHPDLPRRGRPLEPAGSCVSVLRH
eukprot:11181668-Lingulodinium_polyedra.AAC.1